MFYENPNALDPQRRDGVVAGRTLDDAMEEVEQKGADMPDRAAEVSIRCRLKLPTRCFGLVTVMK